MIVFKHTYIGMMSHQTSYHTIYPIDNLLVYNSLVLEL